MTRHETKEQTLREWKTFLNKKQQNCIKREGWFNYIFRMNEGINVWWQHTAWIVCVFTYSSKINLPSSLLLKHPYFWECRNSTYDFAGNASSSPAIQCSSLWARPAAWPFCPGNKRGWTSLKWLCPTEMEMESTTKHPEILWLFETHMAQGLGIQWTEEVFLLPLSESSRYDLRIAEKEQAKMMPC